MIVHAAPFYELGIPLTKTLIAVACVLGIAGCDTLSPNGANSDSHTTPSGLRVEMRVEPGTISAGGTFKVTVSAKNESNRDLIVTANSFASNGVTAFGTMGSLVITKDGAAANAQFSRSGSECIFTGAEIGSTAVKTLAAGQEVMTIPCEMTYTAAQPFQNPNAPRGEYRLTFTFTMTAGAGHEQIPPLSVDLKIRD